MSQTDEPEGIIERNAGGLTRYVRDNPLAMVAGAAILGMLLARFAFLGNPGEER